MLIKFLLPAMEIWHYHDGIRAFCQGRKLLANAVTTCFTAFKATVSCRCQWYMLLHYAVVRE